MRGFSRAFLSALVLLGLVTAGTLPAWAAIPGSVCKKAGQTLISGGNIHTCIKSGSKLVWSAGKPVALTLIKTPVPTVSGQPVVDETLSANAGTWDSGVSLAYQWFAGSSPIPGADDRSYVPTASDVGARISVRVTGLKDGAKSVSKTSAATAPVRVPQTQVPVSSTLKVLTLTPEPSIAGSPKVKSNLTAIVGRWDSGVRFTYQWIRNNVPVSGATKFNYVPVEQDIDTQLAVAVTGTKSGFRPVTRVSQPVTVTSSLLKFPSVVAPQIQGSATVGSVLVAAVGGWGTNGISQQFQWYRSGVIVPNATSNSYRVTSADVGSLVSVTVTGTKSGYLTETRSSMPAGPVQNSSTTSLLVFTNASDPEVSGSLTPGSTLTATYRPWEAGVTYSFQWYNNGSPIAGANQSSYVVGSADTGRLISVSLSGSKPGYLSQTRVKQVGLVSAASFANAPTPVIEGQAREGSTLSLGAGSLNWSSPARTSIQWLKNGIALPGATSSTYVLTSQDVGSVFMVSVTGSATGYATVTKTSAPTGVVSSGSIVGSKPTISGSPQVGQTLTVNTGYWESGVSLSYQWMRNGTPIAGATSTSYLLSTSDNLTSIAVRVTGSKQGLSDLVQTSDSVAVVTTTLTLTPTPVISGTPQVGQVLTANPGTWDSGVSLSYQWFRGGTAISGSTGTTRTLVSADLGQQITVAVTGTKSGFTAVTKTSAAVTVVAGTFVSSPTPTISGTPRLDQTLSATAGTWDSGTTLAYSWLADGAAIPGATSSTLKLTSAHVGKTISVSVTGTKTGLTSVTKTSAGTSAVTAGTFTLQPTPVVSGTAMVGKVLAVSTGIWDSGTTFTYQWKRNGSAIAGATLSNYTLTSSDLNASITCDVTGTLAGNLPITKTSNAVGPVIAAAILLQGTPTITGTAKVGQALSGSRGTWDAGLTYTYQWKRNGTSIAGATSLNYTVVAADLGTTLTFSVTGNSGSVTATKTSSATSAVVAGEFATSPVPTISGTYKVGSVLTATVLAWSPVPTYAFQWLRNDVAIAGATSTSYTLTSADVSASISFKVTGTLSGYTTKSVVSGAGVSVTAGTITPAPTPTISGQPKVGQTLTAVSGTWMAGTSLTYQWLRGGSPITGATATTYVVDSSDVGQNISVSVTGSATGFASTTTTSATVKILTPPKLPTITSTYSKTTQFDVYWTWDANTSYYFEAKNSAGAVVGQYACSTNCVSPFWIGSLPTSSSPVSYTLNYTATTDGGSISGSTTASTYQTLAITVNINSVVKTGDKWVIGFVPVPGWTYFYNDYNPSNSKCNLRGPDSSSSPITIWRVDPGFPTCSQAISVRDNRGNVARVVIPSPTNDPIPKPTLSGGLAGQTADGVNPLAYSVTYFTYVSYRDFTIVISSSSGTIVTPAVASTSLFTGDPWNGTITGQVYFTGLAAGTYTVKGNFRNTYGNTSQYQSIDFGTVTVTG